jgi:hypothetical protein
MFRLGCQVQHAVVGFAFTISSLFLDLCLSMFLSVSQVD